MENRAERAWAWLRACPTWIPRVIFQLMELLTVVGVFLFAFYAGSWIVLGDASNTTRIRMVALLQLVNDNWKAFLLLAIPLYFRPVRTFIEELQEIAGAKRKTRPEAAPTQEDNPSSQAAP